MEEKINSAFKWLTINSCTIRYIISLFTATTSLRAEEQNKLQKSLKQQRTYIIHFKLGASHIKKVLIALNIANFKWVKYANWTVCV